MSELKYSKEQIIDACKEAGLGILECNSLITVLGCCQPEATKPAQDLSAAIDWLRNNYQDHTNIASLCDAMCAALASPADALVAGDRVDVITDTQRMDFQQANPHMYFNVDKRGKRWRFGHFSNYPEDCYGSAREALDAAIQAQKDGHG